MSNDAELTPTAAPGIDAPAVADHADTPDTEAPEAAAPEGGASEAAAPEGGASEAAAPEAAAPEGGASEAAAPEGEASEAAAPTEATHPLPAGTDSAMIIARMAEVVEEMESIAATPDAAADGKHPDDRSLTERMRALEDTYRTLSSSGVQDPALRARLQTSRTTYAGARSNRAELRAVERARAGETKRALLVEAFALSQLAQGTSLAQLAGRRVGDEVTRAEVPAGQPVTEDAAEPSESTVAATQVPAESDADAQFEVSDTEVSDAEVSDAEPDPAAVAPDVTPEDGPAVEPGATEDAQAQTGAAGEQAAHTGSEDVAVPLDDPTETAVADGPTQSEDGATQSEDGASQSEDGAPEPGVESAPAPRSSSVTTIDIAAIARRARELQNEWTAAGFAGREVENELQPLFRRYMQLVFDLSRKESHEKSDARRALVTAARALADQAGEDATNDTVGRLVREAKTLQNQWKAGEAAPPAVESGAWRQFSGALRQIFVARERLAAGAKEEREQIIAAVTALASAREPLRAMRDLGPLLRRWRESGPVPTPLYESLKLQLDRAAATVRDRADSERKRRDAEDAKSSQERSKNASKIIREAERSGRAKRPDRAERPAAAAQAQGALAAALAAAFGRAEGVAEEVRDLERTVREVRERLRLAEAGSLTSTTEEVATEQGFTVRRQSIDPGAANPARLRTELAQAEQALARRQAELAELTTSARGYGIAG